MQRYGSVIKLKPEKEDRIQRTACQCLAECAGDDPEMQYPQLLDLFQGWLFVQLL